MRVRVSASHACPYIGPYIGTRVSCSVHFHISVRLAWVHKQQLLVVQATSNRSLSVHVFHRSTGERPRVVDFHVAPGWDSPAWPFSYVIAYWFWTERTIPSETLVNLLNKNTLIHYFLRKWYNLTIKQELLKWISKYTFHFGINRNPLSLSFRKFFMSTLWLKKRW